jgi:hypothetical protein
MAILSSKNCKLISPKKKNIFQKKKILKKELNNFYNIKLHEFLKKLKEKKFQFKIIQNDKILQNMNSLLSLKILYEKQLPNLPRQYISKFVLNRNNESIIIKKFIGKKFTIIGGCSFRFFKHQQLLELVFFAIKTKEQIKGYGSFLIFVLKHYANFLGFKFIITCADNNAMHFFYKQGFSPYVTSPSFFWTGFIRDYVEITLMEFVLFPKFNYLSIVYFLLIQKLSLIKNFKKFTNQNQIKILRKKKLKTIFFFFLEKVFEKKKKLKKIKKLRNMHRNNRNKKFLSFLRESTENIKKIFTKSKLNKFFDAIELKSFEEKIRFKSNIKKSFKNLKEEIMLIKQGK